MGPRHWFRILFFGCLSALVFILWTSTTPTSAEEPPSDLAGMTPHVGTSTTNDVTPPLREMPLIAPDAGTPHDAPPLLVPGLFDSTTLIEDGAIQQNLSPLAMPAASRNFDGMDNRNGVYPPDTNGDVGLNHYVQTINSSIQIWNKSGTSVYGPANTNTLWQGFGGSCESRNDGDPVVLYDQMAQRWIVTQFTSAAPFGECVAVSTTSDPTGAYYRYFFTFNPNQFYDYPHIGIWPVEGNNSIMLAANRYNGPPYTYAGGSVIALEREAMLAGLPARFVEFQPTGTSTYQPADLDGDNLPAAGSPAPFFGLRNNIEVRLVKVTADWSNPAASTITGPTLYSVTPFNALCSGVTSCIPQPGTTRGLDGVGDRVLQRLAYRKFDTYDTMVISHAVNAATSGTQAGVRWYEIRNPLGASPTFYQQSTYAPDATNRWMPSIAMDGAGNIAVVFSESSGTVFPSIYYAGRLASDPLNTLGQGETLLMAGSGSQTGTASRWGDYAAISADPIDDCTFWMTTEYVATTGSATWKTRIGAFTFPNCLRLQSTVSSQTICQGQTATYPLTLQTGFSAAVTLSASGLPTPATVAFSQNPVAPPFPGSTTATINNTAAAAPGIYNLVFRGTDGTVVDTALTQLTVLGPLLAPTLSAPVDRTVAGDVEPNLTWGAVLGATGYTVEIATDPSFTTIVRTANVTGTSYKINPLLPINTVYYWRVRATTPCGVSPNATVARFVSVGDVATFSRTGLSLAITDNNTAGVTDTLTIPTNATVTDINVSTTITHTWVSDLIVRLVSPNNTRLAVIDRPGLPGSDCSRANIRATLDDQAATLVEGICLSTGLYAIDGTYRPNTLLSGFNGQTAAGTWRLNITDAAAGDTGRLKEWTLQMTTMTPTDFSDLADSHGFAWHTGNGTLRLGTQWGGDTLMPTANGDNASDEGIQIDATGWVPNGSGQALVQVTGGNGYLAGWFDWNQNGVFDHPSEKTIATTVSAGTNTINFTIPATADLSQPVKARFRLYSAEPSLVMGTELPTGLSNGGEVEDYSTFSPLAVELAALQAVQVVNGVDVRWETAAEWNTLGFNIWRGDSTITPTLKLNGEVIPSHAPGNGQGSSYSWLDNTAVPEQPYFYWLESVDISGQTRLYGPVAVEPPAPTALTLAGWELRTDDSRLPWVIGSTVLGVVGVVFVRRRRR